MRTCPLFGKCGGCKLDFAAPDYTTEKLKLLNIEFPEININEPNWFPIGVRRRADFTFTDGVFGFLAQKSHDVVPLNNCPLLSNKLNHILPSIAKLPWSGSGSVQITECSNGIDVTITTVAPYFMKEFANAAEKLPIIKMSWNEKIVFQNDTPIIKFGEYNVQYPSGGFLQPSGVGEEMLLNIIKKHLTDNLITGKLVDLFCGLGAFTLPLQADGFDISTQLKIRDLIKKPLSAGELKRYEAIILDPPRAGAGAQIEQIAKLPKSTDSKTKLIIYVSCNPETFSRDVSVLKSGGWKLTQITPFDQFTGSKHWELVGKIELDDKV